MVRTTKPADNIDSAAPAAAPETVTVKVVEQQTNEPKLSAQTLAEQQAGREALAAQANRK